MKLETLIENKITEWRGKTIADHEHFLEELKVLIADVYTAGKRDGIEECIDGLTVYYRSKFSKDCSRGETEEEKNTEMIELSALSSLKDKSK